MKQTFQEAVDSVLQSEGGFVNHPRDPGGMTCLGVTARTWESWTGRPATEQVMRSLTPRMVAPLYRKNYWQPAGCDLLPVGVDYCVFDFAVNSGPATAVKCLQHTVGVKPDGLVGPATLAGVDDCRERGFDTLVAELCADRVIFMQVLSGWQAFGAGWQRRVSEVHRRAVWMTKR